jgi:hypothetical protein
MYTPYLGRHELTSTNFCRFRVYMVFDSMSKTTSCLHVPIFHFLERARLLSPQAIAEALFCLQNFLIFSIAPFIAPFLPALPLLLAE